MNSLIMDQASMKRETLWCKVKYYYLAINIVYISAMPIIKYDISVLRSNDIFYYSFMLKFKCHLYYFTFYLMVGYI